MAFTFSAQYTPEAEDRLRGFYQTLSEKDQRRFAALEAARLGFGGIKYIAAVLGCSRRTIERATEEIKALPHDPAAGWLEEMGLGLRKIHKVLAGGVSPDRDAQFQRIGTLKTEYFDAGDPVFSFDSKAKEHLGQLFRKGRIWAGQASKAFDHDFPSWADGVLIPHGIYDLARNRGHINLGLSHDTSLFACDSLRWYWQRIGKQCYPNAKSILLLCDSGGSNSASHYIFKSDLQELVNELGIEIRVAHYPSYCSKYNPIEHRLFPHITRSCQGMLFDTLETAIRLMRRAATRTGLRTTVNVIRRVYEVGRGVAKEFKTNMTILFDELLPKLNYRAVPQ